MKDLRYLMSVSTFLFLFLVKKDVRVIDNRISRLDTLVVYMDPHILFNKTTVMTVKKITKVVYNAPQSIINHLTTQLFPDI
jgi:predicted metal-dependent peptidase